MEAIRIRSLSSTFILSNYYLYAIFIHEVKLKLKLELHYLLPKIHVLAITQNLAQMEKEIAILVSQILRILRFSYKFRECRQPYKVSRTPNSVYSENFVT